MISAEQRTRINTLVNVLSRVYVNALDYWLGRVRIAREDSRQPLWQNTIPSFLEEHWEYLVHLLKQATPFPDAQNKAADLALLLDPLMQQKARYRQWLPVVRGLVVALDDGTADAPLKVARLWASVGQCYRGLGDAARATQAFSIANQLTGGQGEAGIDLRHQLLQQKAGMRVWQERYDEALHTAHQLLTASISVGDLFTAALGHTLLAFVQIQSYHPQQAFEQAQQAYVLWRHIERLEKDTSALHSLQALHYMGEACRMNQRLRLAHYYLQRVYEHVAEIDDQSWLARLEQSLGSLALEEGRSPEAIQHIEAARELFQRINDSQGVAGATHALGVALYRAGETAQAEPMLLEAVQQWQAMNRRLETANARYALGKLYRGAGRPVKALETYRAALQAMEHASGHHYDQLRRNLREEIDSLNGHTAPT